MQGSAFIGQAEIPFPPIGKSQLFSLYQGFAVSQWGDRGSKAIACFRFSSLGTSPRTHSGQPQGQKRKRRANAPLYWQLIPLFPVYTSNLRQNRPPDFDQSAPLRRSFRRFVSRRTVNLQARVAEIAISPASALQSGLRQRAWAVKRISRKRYRSPVPAGVARMNLLHSRESF